MTKDAKQLASDLQGGLEQLEIAVTGARMEEPFADVRLAVIAIRQDGSGRMFSNCKVSFLDDVAMLLGFEGLEGLAAEALRRDAKH